MLRYNDFYRGALISTHYDNGAVDVSVAIKGNPRKALRTFSSISSRIVSILYYNGDVAP
jgi:hypothetical protein